MIDYIKDNWVWIVPAWLVLSFGLSVLVGKCIAFGMGTDLEEK